MKTVLWNTVYDEYRQDNLFNPDMCKIGQNLLLPGIRLREELEKRDIALHTFNDIGDDMNDEASIIVFADIPNDSRLTLKGPVALAKYILKNKKRHDAMKYFAKKKVKKLLMISEPRTVWPTSYDKSLYGYFDRIYTWNDDLVDNKKIFKYFIPQPKPEKIEHMPYDKKKLLTLVVSNKTSSDPCELYSERRRAISEAQARGIEFDLYGFGWENMNFKSYRGMVKDKLATVSKYKFAICFENISGMRGYITEKMFDCLFSGTVPIYYGAPNVTDYIPSDIFVDFRKFTSYDELFDFIQNMGKEEYDGYIARAEEYLASEKFKNTFSVKRYADFFADEISGIIE